MFLRNNLRFYILILDGTNVKSVVDLFNTNLQLNSPSNASFPPLNDPFAAIPSTTTAITPAKVYIKYKGLFSFEASQHDELSIKEGDLINVDLTVKTDDGWLWGECQGRTGVFPADYTTKLTDLGYKKKIIDL